MTTKIAVLGLGAMGSRMAANLIKAGHEVTVWNRTAAAAAALVAAGARQAATPRDAAEGVDFVIAMVRDDNASREVWLSEDNGALAGLGKSAIAIESSTLTPGWIRKLGDEIAANGNALLEAPVSGSRPQAEAGQLVYFIGGDESVLKQAEPILKTLGSSIHHVGSLGSGAWSSSAPMRYLAFRSRFWLELIGLLKRSRRHQRSLQAIAGAAAWSPAANNLSSSMLAGNFAPLFPIELIEKDFGYAVEAAGSPEAAPTIAAARGVFQAAIARGLKAENMTGVVQLFTQQER